MVRGRGRGSAGNGMESGIQEAGLVTSGQILEGGKEPECTRPGERVQCIRSSRCGLSGSPPGEGLQGLFVGEMGEQVEE